MTLSIGLSIDRRTFCACISFLVCVCFGIVLAERIRPISRTHNSCWMDAGVTPFLSAYLLKTSHNLFFVRVALCSTSTRCPPVLFVCFFLATSAFAMEVYRQRMPLGNLKRSTQAKTRRQYGWLFFASVLGRHFLVSDRRSSQRDPSL